MIQYPNKKTIYQKPKTSVKNRGMRFEACIDESNDYYNSHHKAVIHKKPTPIQIVKVDYPSRQAAKITEAYYKTPSTTDYNGVYKGKYIDFDVKETQNKTSFPLKNIHPHQISHLKAVHAQNGIAFLLIYFSAFDTIHFLPYAALDTFIKRAVHGRQSITYQELLETGYIIQEGINPRIDYLKIVDMMYSK